MNKYSSFDKSSLTSQGFTTCFTCTKLNTPRNNTYNIRDKSDNYQLDTSLSGLASCNASVASFYASVTLSNASVTSSNAYLTSSNAHLTASNASVTSSNAYLTSSNAHLTSSNAHLTSSNAHPESSRVYYTYIYPHIKQIHKIIQYNSNNNLINTLNPQVLA